MVLQLFENGAIELQLMIQLKFINSKIQVATQISNCETMKIKIKNFQIERNVWRHVFVTSLSYSSSSVSWI